MKKVLSIAFLFVILGVLLLPTISLAQQSPKDYCVLKNSLTDIDTDWEKGKTICDIDATCDVSTTAWGIACTLDAVYTASNWIFTSLIVLASIFVIFGAFTIMTAGGAVEKVSTGRQYIIYALVGLAVALLSRAIPSIVSVLLGV